MRVPLVRAPRSRIATALTGTLVLSALAAPAILPATAASAAPTPRTPDAVASAQAVATGRPVVVDADTTVFSTVTANPDGSFTLHSNVAPQQVKHGSTWVPVDATLAANADGTLSPKAAAAGLRLSSGGTGPLATFDDGAGHQLSVTMPMSLPAPRITGATALYPSVLAGVDLSVTAGVDGGIHEVLIVHDAKAAANPALASLTLATATRNLTVATGADGSITATDTVTGATVFSAPPSVMWDSHTVLPVTKTAGAETTTAGPSDLPAASTTTGPGVNAVVTSVPVRASSGHLTLSPPKTALSGTGVVYPAFIDPGISGTLAAYAYTQSFHPTTTAYKPTDNLRVGYDDWTTNCGSPCYQNGISRTFLHYTGLSAIDGKDVTASSLSLTQLSASCTGTYTINAAITSGNTSFSSTLDWNNQPAASGVVDNVGMSGTDGGKTINFDTIGPYMAAHTYTQVYLVLYASSEGDHCTWRHFGLTPGLSVTYWSTPNTPASQTEKNGTASYACNTTSPGTWIPLATSNQISLNDTVSTPDANTALTSNMYLSTNGGAYADQSTSVTETTANTAIPVSKTITLTDGSNYHWYATAANSFKTSGNSSTCYFQYDGTSPTNPTSASTDFPVQGPTTITVGGTGTITVTSGDGGTNPSGLSSIAYDIDGTGIASGGVTGSATPTGNNATISVPLADLHWGTNTVWLQAKDVAGNKSAVESYNFFVQQSAFGPYSPGTAGDIDGDNQPDLVTVDTAGDIQLYSNPAPGTVDPTGNTTIDPYQYGGQVLVPANQNLRWPDPDSASAANALIAHAGSFTGNNYDDLVVEQNGFMGVATNPGSGGTWTFATTNVPKPACGTCTNYNGTDWSSVEQMIAVPTTAGSAPDLLTVETVNNASNVWLYTPIQGVYRWNAPTLIANSSSTWNWHNAQLLGAATLPGTTGTTLFVRTFDTGAIETFPNVLAGIGANPSTATHTVVASSGYSPSQYPLMTTTGQADAAGDLPIWATDSTGHLDLVPTTTSTSGVTTIGAPSALSTAANWASHVIALGGDYVSFNNDGIDADGAVGTPFDTATSNANAYSATALANSTLDNNAATVCPASWTIACPSGVSAGSTVVVPLSNGTYDFRLSTAWNNLADNYVAAGQVLPAPIPGTSGPAHYLSFLGAAATSDSTNGASVSATITYTDGGTQAVTIQFADWTHDNDSAPIGTETTVASQDHRLTAATGATSAKVTYLFASGEIQLLDHGVALPAGVQIASITLGSNSAVHIFSSALS